MVWFTLMAVGCSPRDFQIHNRTTSPGTSSSPTEPGPSNDTADETVPPPVCASDACADIVFVIDTSRSMDGIQSELAQSAAGLFEALPALDYHLGAISMDLVPASDAGVLQPGLGARFLTRQTPDPGAAFTEMVQLGSGGSSREAGIGTAYLLLFSKSDTPQNAGFRRPGVPLHLIFVSDEDDQTSDERRSEAIEGFAGLDGGAHAHSLVSYSFARGRHYLELTDLLGGYTAPIETADFGEFLDEVALSILGP